MMQPQLEACCWVSLPVHRNHERADYPQRSDSFGDVSQDAPADRCAKRAPVGSFYWRAANFKIRNRQIQFCCPSDRASGRFGSIRSEAAFEPGDIAGERRLGDVGALTAAARPGRFGEIPIEFALSILN